MYTRLCKKIIPEFHTNDPRLFGLFKVFSKGSSKNSFQSIIDKDLTGSFDFWTLNLSSYRCSIELMLNYQEYSLSKSFPSTSTYMNGI